VTWIRHLKLYEAASEVVKAEGGMVEVLVHPQHRGVKIDLNLALSDHIKGIDETLQLYLFSTGWIIPVIESGDDRGLSLALDLLERIVDLRSMTQSDGSHGMVWDDHAVCERLCVLVELISHNKKSAFISFDLANKIAEEIEVLKLFIDNLLRNEKWKNNNHRLFHLLASFVYADSKMLADEKSAIKDEIESFVSSIFDKETGFSLEQSISYCSFDLAIIKNINGTLTSLLSPLDTDLKSLEFNLNSHVGAISFPDGTLPASGDTPLGLKLTEYQKKFVPVSANIFEHWERLSRIGYYRGCSSGKNIHFLMLTHNVESPHGHTSPLHTDFWVKDFGSLLVDVGGP